MKVERVGDTVRVSAIARLAAADAKGFRESVMEQMRDGGKNIAIDLSQTTFIDSSGLGALVALRKAAIGQQGALRLLNPQPPVQQILELTRLDALFEIVNPGRT